MPFKLISAFFVFTIKAFTKVFYRTDVVWLTPKDKIEWEQLRLFIVLNHTSLFEFLFASAIPNYRLWRAIDRVVVPVADVTMNRPFAGKFFKALVPNAIPITRKRDDSWSQLMDKVAGNSLLLIFPEGRMKRLDGLDKHGKPMSVKGGVVDILNKLDSGKMMIAYSGGLHHVQAPGQAIPKVFQTIRCAFEQLDIVEYKKQFADLPEADFRQAIIKDLEDRMRKNIP